MEARKDRISIIDLEKRKFFCKRADKKVQERLIDPRICSFQFKETDITFSISVRKNIPSGCYPTIFDPKKANKFTSACALEAP